MRRNLARELLEQILAVAVVAIALEATKKVILGGRFAIVGDFAMANGKL